MQETQSNLIKLTKLDKFCNDDIYYKDFAESLKITEHSFYNWLNGYYKLSYSKTQQLLEIVYDLVDEDLLKNLDNIR